MQRLLFVTALTLSPILLRGQGVVRSVPSAYPTIPAAIAASAPGDTVEIASGTYPPFDCAIGLTFRAVTPGAVNIQLFTGLIGSVPLDMTFSAPPAEPLQCVGLRFVFPNAGPTVVPMLTLGGRVAMEDCEFGQGRGTVSVPATAVAHLQSVIGHGPSLVVDGKLTATQCDVRALNNLLDQGRAAVHVEGTLHATACQFVGGGGSTFFPAGAAISSGAQARIDLSDCSVDQGFGLWTCPLTGGGSFRLVRCTSNDLGCLPAQLAEGLGVERTGALQLGSPWGVTYRNQPSQIVGIHAGGEIGDVALPIFEQNWTAPLGASFALDFAVTDALGQATFGWTLPSSTSLIGAPLWLHGFSGLSLPLQVSPPAGGLLR